MHNLTAVFHSYPQISPQVFDISSCKRKKLPTGSRLSPHSLLPTASKHGCFFAWAISRNFHRTKKGMCLQKTHALKPDEQSVVGSVELILGILARDAIHRESMILLEGSDRIIRPLTIDAVCGARLLIARVQQSLLKPLDRIALAAPIQQAVARRRASGRRRRTGSRLRRGRIENLLRIGVCRLR